jgi:cholesterol oxidase
LLDDEDGEGLAQMPQGERFDAVVVGSGFGGSVAAYRLAAAGRSVCLLERGKTYPPGSFPRTPRDMARNVWDPSEGRHGLFNVWSFRGIEAVVASGLGGGSLIYANVLLRKDERWFVHEQPFDGGYEHWPIGRADLEPHYDEVERMLGAQALPFDAPGYSATPKTVAMRLAAERLGLEWQLPKLAVTFANAGTPPAHGEPIPAGEYPNLHGGTRVTCRMCGECDIGCNYGAKNTLDHTYLSAAAHKGAEIRSRCEVRRFAPLPGGGYRVWYVRHDPDREGKPTKTSELPEMVVDADRLVLAAGTLGSTYLLLRNLDAFPALSPRALGTRFSGNGDLLTFVVGRSDGSSRLVDGSRGPVITSAIRVPDELDGGGGSGRGYYVEDAGYPGFVDWMIEGAESPRGVRRLLRFVARRLWARLSRDPRSDLSAELGALLGSGALSSSSLPLLGMGRDVPDGVMRLAKGYLDVDWTTATSAAYFDRVRSTMRDIATELGASFRDNPLWWRRRVITVHPLGGCPMGRHQAEGVVNADGEVFGYPGLFVCDGSVMPGPVGANPSLTIAAFADRMATRIAEGDAAGRKVLT